MTVDDDRAALHALIDHLDDERAADVRRYAEARVHPAVVAALNAPVDTAELSEEDLAAIDEGLAELDRGLGIPHAEIKRKYGR